MWLDRIVARVLGYIALAAFVVGGEWVAAAQMVGIRFTLDLLVVAGLLFAAPVAGGTLLAALFARRSVFAYGLAAPNALPMLVSGAAWGTALVLAFVAVLLLTGQVTLFRPAMPFGYAFHLTTMTVAFFGLFAFTEALCFQGLVLTIASRHAGPAVGAVIAAAAFAFVHVPAPGLGPIGIATLFVAGLGFALMVRITGSIWWNVGFLAAFDWVQSVFYGNPPGTSLPHLQALMPTLAADKVLTGGTYGIEGSVLMLPVALGVVAVLFCIATKRNPLRRVFGRALTVLAACTPATRMF